jgi:hypothetical protein
MLTQLRLAWRLQRWELGLLIGSGLALTAVALALPSLGEAGIGDQRMIVLFLTVAGPVLMGSVLGTGIVARDVELGTARISWSLTGSRLRWIWLRLWPIALVGGLIGVLLGAASARLMDLTSPSDIFTFQMRGPVVALHFIIAAAIAMLVGSVVRRVLPALLLALMITVGAFVAEGVLLQSWLRDQAELVPFAERMSEPVLAVLEHERATIAADGTLVVSQPQCATQAECMEAYDAMTQVMLVVPGEAYWPLLALESALAVGTVAVSMLGTTAITRRWGPR